MLFELRILQPDELELVGGQVVGALEEKRPVLSSKQAVSLMSQEEGDG